MKWGGCQAIFLIACAFVATTVHAQFLGQNDWVSMWALNGQSEEYVAKQLVAEYEMRIRIMDRTCGLDQSQEKKLKLAAEADITRFRRDITRTRAKLGEMKIDNNNVQEAWEVVSPLATRIQKGLFNEGSLFDKVFKSSLDDSQQQLFEAELKQDRERRWRAITRTNLADIELTMPLLSHQREKLLKLMDEVEVPKKLNRHMDGYVGYLRLIKVEEKNLKEFLDEHQIEVIDQYRERYRGWAGMFQ